MSPRLTFAIEAAKRAGQSTLRHFGKGVQVETKADRTPVTVADREAEAMIRAEIQAQFPEDEILGEEEGGSTSPNRWVIDPIDGTKSFVSGVPLFATLISYESDGAPSLGVCYFPALDEIVFAERGYGCFWNDSACRVSTVSDLSEAVICCAGHDGLVKTGKLEGVLKLASQCMATRTWCDAYGHALVATGRAEAMIDPRVSRWDISPMKVIVEEAGGRFTDFQGVDLLADEAISANVALHRSILEAFRA